MADIIVIAGIISMGLLYMVMLIQGFWEIVTTRKLHTHAQSVRGHIDDVDIKSAGQAGSYGKVIFRYTVNDITYSKKQTVNKYTAMALLSGSKEVTVLFLPKKPSVARLALNPSNYTRILGLIIALIILGILGALILIGILRTTSMSSTY